MIVRILSEIVIRWKRWLTTIAVLAVAGFSLFVYRHLFLSDRLVDARREWSAFREELRRNPSATKIAVYEQALADISAFDGRIPKTDEFARVIGDLFALSESNSLTVGGVAYTPGTGLDGYLDYSLTIDASGSYPGVKSFVTDLLRNGELIAIEQCSLSKTGKVFDEEVTVRLKLRMMFRQNRQGGER